MKMTRTTNGGVRMVRLSLDLIRLDAGRGLGGWMVAHPCTADTLADVG